MSPNCLTETGMYYYRARYYEPSIGRFLGEDPIRGRGSLYPYVRNNPASRVDPMGLQDAPCLGCGEQAGRVKAGFAGVCGALMKPSCALALYKNGLLPCFQRICYYGECPTFSTPPWGTVCAETTGRDNVVLYPQAFRPGCGDSGGDLQGTIAHELTHICFYRGQGPPLPNGEKDCDWPSQNRDQYGRPLCSDASRAATNKRTSEIERGCSGR